MQTEQQIISAFIEELKNQSRGYIRSLKNGESEEMDAELEDALKKNEVIIKALKSYDEVIFEKEMDDLFEHNSAPLEVISDEKIKKLAEKAIPDSTYFDLTYPQSALVKMERNCFIAGYKAALQSSAPLQDKDEKPPSEYVWDKDGNKTANKPVWDLGENEYLDFSKMEVTDEVKKEFVNKITFACARELMKVFMSCSLKTHIEQMVKNDFDGKEFVLTFQTLESFQKRFVSAPLQEQEEYELVSIGEETVKLVIPPHPDQSSAPLQEQDKKDVDWESRARHFEAEFDAANKEIIYLQEQLKEFQLASLELEIQLAQAEEHICNLERNQA